ncbi:CPBP family intramembrane metalloprotease [Streptomyces sp. XM4193]|uniref:CPBP family intramembrane glutamic endopeptidase n=1 Tax=Streptomyces sp. XM4193 TaxID=2929782 RepID=UPI001FFA4EC2|nr:CPBP family intramembrane glutamic endopeptidase [Streptomyces sp. XM4193]MCK1796262.1 CPBP family intramembrane metalloprotease [Streptomyces sp. XM4193]
MSLSLHRSPGTAFGIAVGVLAGAHVLDHRLGPPAHVPVSLASTGLLLLTARGAGLSAAELGLGRARLGHGLRCGATAAAGVGALYAAGALLPATRPLFADGRAEERLPGLLRQMLLEVPLGTVLLEEVGFRCVLPALLRRSCGPRLGEAVPVALFGLWHVLPSAALAASNPALAAASTGNRAPGGDGVSRTAAASGSVAVTAAGGAVFAALRRHTGSALAPALLHTAFNSLGYLAAWSVNRRSRRRTRRS